MHCLVLVNTRSPGIGNGLTYETGGLDIRPGMLVRVPLRKSLVEGIVISTGEAAGDDTFEAKPVKEIIGTFPLLTKTQLQFARWIAGQYACSLSSAIRPFLPPPPWSAAVPDARIIVRKTGDLGRGGQKQQAVMAYLADHHDVTRGELIAHTGATAATLKSLIDKRCIDLEKELPDEAAVPQAYELFGTLPELTPIQRDALREIETASKPSLLFGVTGSGKTEIYMHLIAAQAARGRQSILLLPEILLTEQIIGRFERLFHARHIAVIHSRLTPGGKRREWKRIASGEAALVIGSRSALFSPCRNPGIIVIDEEHEWTYKNEQSPRYHAREAAEHLCALSDTKLVLGSATPSLESWHRAKSGRYARVDLPERYRNRPMPSVRIVDLATVDFGTLYPFSPPLLAAMRQRLERKEQTILFLNRRGVATSILCLECRKRLTSPASHLPFTLHRGPDGRPYLLDHVAGLTAAVPPRCPHCSSPKLQAVGAGTQRLEDVVGRVFPQARVLRADSDTLTHPRHMRELLDAMRDGKADILLGTQSVVKGLDLPGVTLAAVLLADTGLSLPHFRAGERVFQLLTQLTGRSGRAVPGDVIIQTYRPGAPEVEAAAMHRTEEYLDAELSLRQRLTYPPFAPMIRLLVRGERAEARANVLHRTIVSVIGAKRLDASATVSPTLFSGGREWHILLKGNDVRSLLQLNLDGATVDIDPVDLV